MVAGWGSACGVAVSMGSRGHSGQYYVLPSLCHSRLGGLVSCIKDGSVCPLTGINSRSPLEVSSLAVPGAATPPVVYEGWAGRAAVPRRLAHRPHPHRLPDAARLAAGPPGAPRAHVAVTRLWAGGFVQQIKIIVQLTFLPLSFLFPESPLLVF